MAVASGFAGNHLNFVISNGTPFMFCVFYTPWVILNNFLVINPISNIDSFWDITNQKYGIIHISDNIITEKIIYTHACMSRMNWPWPLSLIRYSSETFHENLLNEVRPQPGIYPGSSLLTFFKCSSHISYLLHMQCFFIVVYQVTIN